MEPKQTNELSDLEINKPKTINDFIKDLQRIAEKYRNLPLVIDCPNRMEVYPKIKMRYDDPMEMLQKTPDKMVITWDGY